MRKRTRSLLWIAIVSPVIAVGAFLFSQNSQPKYQFTKAHYEQIQLPTTEEEVERILGAPAGRYTNGLLTHDGIGEAQITDVPLRVNKKEWVCNEVINQRGFDEQGRGVIKSFQPVKLAPESIIAKFRRLFRI